MDLDFRFRHHHVLLSRSEHLDLRSSQLQSLKFARGFAMLPTEFWEARNPSPLADPYFVAISDDAAKLVGLDPRLAAEDPHFLAIAAGNELPQDATPIATVYAGHQFGSWAGRLGDGRAILLGEVAGYEWQLKGSGLTAFSRFADGRAVLRSTIREFLCSEAMDALGIPSTRGLCIAGSDEPVYREQAETAAVLTRLAPSHIRFGSFEMFHYGDRNDLVKVLADYTIDRYYPQLRETDPEETYLAFLREIVARTARLVAQWQAVGFAHGVMNTDNMSILGLTIDYGPFGFLDAYDPKFICNHSDDFGRYAFDRQPTIALWNCYALAEALGSLLDVDAARAVLGSFEPVFQTAYLTLLRAKLGVLTEEEDDALLLGDLHHLMERDAADYTAVWRSLATVTRDDEGSFAGYFRDREALAAWLLRYRARLEREGSENALRRTRMNAVNPKFVLRNYLAQNAIEAAQRKDFSEVRRLLGVLRRPFEEQPENESYAAPPPDWGRHVIVSCSS
ncbi:MAG: protein adenylyltransferase SelO [Vulcanimicrobiaceae bacterium]